MPAGVNAVMSKASVACKVKAASSIAAINIRLLGSDTEDFDDVGLSDAGMPGCTAPLIYH